MESVVLAVEQKLCCQMSVLIGGFNVSASVVVADDFAAALEHQLGNASALDAPLGAFHVLLYPVVKNLNGVTNTTLAPQGSATRAQVSAILHRFCDGVVK